MAAKRVIRRCVLAALAFGLVASCGADEVPVTELLLVVDSDFPYTDLAKLELEVSEPGDAPHTVYTANVTADTPWPVKFGLVHSGGELGRVTATVKAALRSPRASDVLTRTNVATCGGGDESMPSMRVPRCCTLATVTIDGSGSQSR